MFKVFALIIQITLPLIFLTLISHQLTKHITFLNYKSINKPAPFAINNNSNNNNDNDDDDDNNQHQHQNQNQNQNHISVEARATSGLPTSTPEKCDLFSGEWVPNAEGPYYDNTSCWAIHNHQNCIKYGRPDNEFMKWRWKPNGCELPVFDPHKFLEIVRGKSLAFVGDSVARNHMQSLICLLSRVQYPMDVSPTKDDFFKRLNYTSYNFTLASFWTPFLVHAQQNDSNGPSGTGIFGIHLDEADESWKTQIDEFDYIIISAGHWFFRSLMYYEQQKLIGCRYCQMSGVIDYPMAFGYSWAFRTAFRTILEREKFKGIVYLRTFAPAHFEGGEWNNGGNCLRQRPLKNNEIMLEGSNLDLYMAQIMSFKEAEKLGRKRGIRFRLMDMTKPMLLRPDGHPSKYGHWPNETVTLYNDCVHWCLPGPIDSWNDFLQEMLRSDHVIVKEENVFHSAGRRSKFR